MICLYYLYNVFNDIFEYNLQYFEYIDDLCYLIIL